MGERTFRVDQIHCEGCTATIREALGRLEGVEKVEPDVATHTVRVAYAESRVDVPTIAERLAEAGFPAKEPVTDREPAGRPDGGESPWWARYGVLTVAIVLVALAGYVGYELYPRFDLPAAEGVGLLALAAGAGIASFFAPCSFPLLVTLLSRQVGPSGRGSRRGGGRGPLVFALALSGGAVAFLVLMGLLIGFGGSAFAASVTFTSTVGITLRVVVGSLLILLGLIQLGVFAASSFHAVETVTKRFNRSQAQLRREHPVKGFAAFGFFYLLAGFG
jgi:cytochrome c biogenesis protein CcdA/copper chaperone CopZ